MADGGSGGRSDPVMTVGPFVNGGHSDWPAHATKEKYACYMLELRIFEGRRTGTVAARSRFYGFICHHIV